MKKKDIENMKIPDFVKYVSELEQKIKEYEKEQKPKFEEGWYWSNERAKRNKLWLCYYSQQGYHVSYGFNACGEWSDGLMAEISHKHIKATKEEVEEALIAEAKRRGFKEGVTIFRNREMELAWDKHCGEGEYGTEIINGSHCCMADNSLLVGGLVVFTNGLWAEIIEDKLEINGYKVAKDEDSISIGCKTGLCIEEFKTFVAVADFFDTEYIKADGKKFKVKDLKKLIQ